MNCSRLQLTNASKFYFKYHKNIISVFHKTSFRKKHAMVMIVVAWLSGPIFTVSRIIPTSQVTADGICIQNLSWPSQSVLVHICLNHYLHRNILFPVFLYFIFIFFNIYFSTKKSLKGRRNRPRLGHNDQSEGKRLDASRCNGCIFPVLDLERFFLFSVQCRSSSRHDGSVL